jgi:hypothetical protein
VSGAAMLARMVDVLRAIGSHDALTLANAIERYLQGDGELEELLGLRSISRARRPSTKFAITRRNDLIRETAARFYPGPNQSDQARRLHQDLHRYAYDGDWKRERGSADCPRRSGTLKAALWSILKARNQVLSVETIRACLLLSNGYSLTANHNNNSEIEGDRVHEHVGHHLERGRPGAPKVRTSNT